MLYREGFPTDSFKVPLDANSFLPASLYSLITNPDRKLGTFNYLVTKQSQEQPLFSSLSHFTIH